MELFITILQLICGLIVIGIVLFQSGKSAGLSGAIGGVADSFMAKFSTCCNFSRIFDKL